MLELLLKLIDGFVNIINDVTKSIITIYTGVVVGYVPKAASIINEQPMTSPDVWFQRIVWCLTIIVTLLAIVAGIQKQYDRYLKKKKERNENNIIEGDKTKV